MSSGTVRTAQVPEGLSGERVDVAVHQLFGYSRSRAAEFIAQGFVAVDGVPVAKSHRLLPGSELELTAPPEPPAWHPEQEPAMELPILYEDADLVAVNKPVGMAAHASPGWEGATVIGALMASGHRITTSGAAEKQGIVQRLDVGTSGVMVVAKSEHAYSVMKNYFRNREVEKQYHTVVQGRLDPLAGTIDAPIGRHPRHDGRFAVTADGRPSITHYETLEAFVAASLVQVQLETGRTHQIRVHMAAMRHPCVGDPMYGGDPVLAARLGLTRQWLHATKVGFIHPTTQDFLEISAPYPEDLAQALACLREDSGLAQ